MNISSNKQQPWQSINEWLILLAATLTLLGWQTRSYHILFFIIGLNISVWVLASVFLPRESTHRLPHELWWFLIWLVISSLFSSYYSNTIFEIVKITSFLLLSITTANHSSAAFPQKFFSLLMSLGIISGLIGIYDFFQLSSPFAGVAATFGWRNTYAGWLLLIIPITVTLYLTKKNKNWQIPSFIASMLSLTMLFLTFSQAAWIAALIILCLLLVIFRRLKIPGLGKKFSALLLTTALFSFLLISLHGLAVSANTNDSFTDSANISAVSLSNRLDYWSSTLQLIREHALFGVGLGNFATHYPRYQHNLWTFTTSPHNSLLIFAAEMGIAGAILWIFFLGSLLYKILIAIHNMPRQQKIMLVSIALSLLASFLHSMFDFDWDVPGIWLLWWLELGLLFQWITTRELQSRSKVSAPIYGLLIGLYLTTHAISNNIRSQAAIVFAESIDPSAAAPLLHSNIFLAPENAETWQLLAENARLNILAHYGDREEQAYDLWRYSKKALELEPDNARRHFQQGVYLALITNRDDQHIYEAEQALQKAVELDSWNHPEYYLQLALFYTRLGENEKALLTINDALKIYTGEAMQRLFLDT